MTLPWDEATKRRGDAWEHSGGVAAGGGAAQRNTSGMGRGQPDAGGWEARGNGVSMFFCSPPCFGEATEFV